MERRARPDGTRVRREHHRSLTLKISLTTRLAPRGSAGCRRRLAREWSPRASVHSSTPNEPRSGRGADGRERDAWVCETLWVCPRGSRVGANGPRKFWRSRPVSQTDVSAVNSTTRGAAHAPTRWDASSRASGVPPISARIAAPCSRDPRYVPVAPADARSAPVASSCALFFGHALSERRGCPAAPPLDADARIVPHDPAPKIPRVHSVDPDRHVPS